MSALHSRHNRNLTLARANALTVLRLGRLEGRREETGKQATVDGYRTPEPNDHANVNQQCGAGLDKRTQLDVERAKKTQRKKLKASCIAAHSSQSFVVVMVHASMLYFQRLKCLQGFGSRFPKESVQGSKTVEHAVT